MQAGDGCNRHHRPCRFTRSIAAATAPTLQWSDWLCVESAYAFCGRGPDLKLPQTVQKLPRDGPITTEAGPNQTRTGPHRPPPAPDAKLPSPLQTSPIIARQRLHAYHRKPQCGWGACETSKDIQRPQGRSPTGEKKEMHKPKATATKAPAAYTAGA